MAQGLLEAGVEEEGRGKNWAKLRNIAQHLAIAKKVQRGSC